jgi:hypothetical protein
MDIWQYQYPIGFCCDADGRSKLTGRRAHRGWLIHEFCGLIAVVNYIVIPVCLSI